MAARKRRKKKTSRKQKHSLLSKILLAVNILIIMGLLMAYSAPYVNPQKFVLPAFFGLAYPYIAAVNFIFIIIWIILNKYFFIWSLMALMAGWYHLTSHIQFRNEKDIQGTGFDMKIMSYNVRMFDFLDWKNDQSVLNSILSGIETEAPDVLCIQEFYNNAGFKPSLPSRISAIHGLDNRHTLYFHQRQGGHQFGIASFTSFRILERKDLKLSGSNRSFGIFTDIIVKDDTIRVYNLHLASVRFGYEDYDFVSDIGQSHKTNKELKEGSVRIIRKLARAFRQRAAEANAVAGHVESSPYPVIVCGDFNDTPVSYTYRVIGKGLKDAFKTSGNGIGQTYSGKLPPLRIDFIFHSPELKAFNFKVGRQAESDHYPITCYFQFVRKHIDNQ